MNRQQTLTEYAKCTAAINRVRIAITLLKEACGYDTRALPPLGELAEWEARLQERLQACARDLEA